jgi:glycosyltransferase involved in cell wall biosynthesis
MVLPALHIGGMENMAGDLGRALAQRGHRVGFTCIEEDGALAEGLRREGLPVTVVSCPGVLPNFIAGQALSSHFAQSSLDVVHAHDGVWGKAASAARAAAVKAVVLTCHGPVHAEAVINTGLRHLAARNADTVVAVSEPLSEYLRKRARIPLERVLTILNGVDVERFSPGSRTGVLRRTLSISEDATVVGCVARLDLVKNPALLIVAVHKLQDAAGEIHLVFVGKGPMTDQIRAEIARVGLERRVHLAGSFEETSSVYRDLDIFALASQSEGTSMSVLEAMATGLPVVATRVGGTPQLLGDPPCGRLVPAGDVEAFTTALREIASDPVSAAALGKAARARATAQFNLRHTVDAYERLYHTLLSRTDRSPRPRSH